MRGLGPLPRASMDEKVSSLCSPSRFDVLDPGVTEDGLCELERGYAEVLCDEGKDALEPPVEIRAKYGL